MSQPSDHPNPTNRRPIPSTRAALVCWLALSSLLLATSLPMLLFQRPSQQLLRAEFARDPSGKLHLYHDWGPGGGIIRVTSQQRRSFVVVWEETTVQWTPSPPPASEVDAALAAFGMSLEDRRLASLPPGTTATLRPSLGLLFVPLFALLLVAPAFQLRDQWLNRRARARIKRGRCGACGYDRQATPADAACPECGNR